MSLLIRPSWRYKSHNVTRPRPRMPLLSLPPRSPPAHRDTQRAQQDTTGVPSIPIPVFPATLRRPSSGATRRPITRAR
ncbi:hypothetical protein NLI96_g9279 [Meripilus lineatus]|uniref:Uncharacterized protein n=1 Tax=Meripilus lineatus TaxID=2056292 RepID=A0AAD5YFD2_9APHY|nr:hypothetical protein NLI96_g9279 [Physisporinus lineatus]